MWWKWHHLCGFPSHNPHFPVYLFIWHVGSLVAAYGVRSSSLSRDGTPGPLHWEHRVLATGPPGKPPHFLRKTSDQFHQRDILQHTWPVSTPQLSRSFRNRESVPDFPGGSVVKTLSFQCRGQGSSIRWRGTKIPHVSWPKNVNKQKPRNIQQTVMAKRYLRSHDS